MAIAASATALAFPAVAAADVQVLSVPSQLVCGDAINVGIREKPGTVHGGTTRISVFDHRDRRWWHRTASASASGEWRTWLLPSGRRGQCGTTTVVYRIHNGDGSSWTLRRTVRFRSEGV